MEFASRKKARKLKTRKRNKIDEVREGIDKTSDKKKMFEEEMVR